MVESYNQGCLAKSSGQRRLNASMRQEQIITFYCIILNKKLLFSLSSLKLISQGYRT